MTTERDYCNNDDIAKALDAEDGIERAAATVDGTRIVRDEIGTVTAFTQEAADALGVERFKTTPSRIIVTEADPQDGIERAREAPQEPCQDCIALTPHCYSDATTPGFFYNKCPKHRVDGIEKGNSTKESIYGNQAGRRSRAENA